MTFRKKILLLIIFCVIIPMFLLPVINYNRYETILKDKINITTQQTLSQTSKNIDGVIENIIASSNMLCLDEELINILKSQGDNKNTWEKYSDNVKITKKISNAQIASLYPYNSYIAIIDFNNNIFNSSEYPMNESYSDIIKEEWFTKTVNLRGYMLWMAPSGSFMPSKGDSKNDIVMTRLIMDQDSKKGIGVIVMRLGIDAKINSIIKSDSQVKESKMYLINEKGNVILSNLKDNENQELNTTIVRDILSKEGNGSYTNIVNGVKYVENYYTVQKTGWKIVQLIPYNSLMKEVDELRRNNYIMNIIITMILIIIAYIICWSMTKPLHKLSILMSKVPDGNFDIRADVKGTDEVAKLGESFNSMVEEIDVLIKKLREEYEYREELRLEALQAQINPHFLLNTLNGIKWMATMNKDESVSKMLSSLGYLLETTLGKNEEMITLSEEIKCINSYVELQKMRYGDKFEVNYELDNTLMKYTIPCLLLQPIVENAIIHGLYEKEEEGIINIKLSHDISYVFIEINDNGKGMDKETLDKILSNENKQSGRFSNIGIKNVNERIKLRYGSQYGITVSSEENLGTTVTIKLPYRGDVYSC